MHEHVVAKNICNLLFFPFSYFDKYEEIVQSCNVGNAPKDFTVQM